MKKILFLGLLAITFFAHAFSYAYNRAGVTTITVGGSGYFFSSKRHLQNTAGPNLAIGYNFTDCLAWEGSIAAIFTNSRLSTINHVQGYSYAFDGIYRFLPYRCVEPYVIGGIGNVALKPAVDMQNVNQPNIHAGLGAQIFSCQLVALRCEVRDLYTFSGGKNDVVVNLGASFVL